MGLQRKLYENIQPFNPFQNHRIDHGPRIANVPTELDTRRAPAADHWRTELIRRMVAKADLAALFPGGGNPHGAHVPALAQRRRLHASPRMGTSSPWATSRAATAGVSSTSPATAAPSAGNSPSAASSSSTTAGTSRISSVSSAAWPRGNIPSETGSSPGMGIRQTRPRPSWSALVATH